MPASSERPEDLALPRLPVRASIYVAPDGSVHFGALFAELVPVAVALSRPPSCATEGRDLAAPATADPAGKR